MVIERKGEKRSCPQTRRSTFHPRVNQSSTIVGRFTSFDTSYRANLFTANSACTHIQPLVHSPSFSSFPFITFFWTRTRFVAAFATFSFPVRFKFTRDTNFRDALLRTLLTTYSHARCKTHFITA